MILIKRIIFCGVPTAVVCDGKCNKAWGINSRPEGKGDNELGKAPKNPGTSEGKDIKPQTKQERLNKWCVRECERSILAPLNFNELAVKII